MNKPQCRSIGVKKDDMRPNVAKVSKMKPQFLWLAAALSTLLLLAAGCTHKPYHPTKSDREWAIDHKACEEWAREGIRDDPDTYDAMDEMKMIKICMKEKGWEWKRTSLFRSREEPAE
jgi:hypothetical protein